MTMIEEHIDRIVLNTCKKDGAFFIFDCNGGSQNKELNEEIRDKLQY